MPSTNLTPATAINVSSFPYNEAIQFSDAPPQVGTEYSRWYRILPGVFPVAISTLIQVPAGASFSPEVRLWNGPASAVTPFTSDGSQVGATGTTQIVPLRESVEIFIEARTNAASPPLGPAYFTIFGEVLSTVPIGSIFITDEFEKFPCFSMSSDNGTPLRYFKFDPTEEQGILCRGNGVLAHLHKISGVSYTNLYTPQMVLIASVQNPWEAGWLGTDEVSNFFVGRITGGTPGDIRRLSSAGVFDATLRTIPGAAVSFVAAGRDNTTIYYMSDGTEDIRRYDFNTNTVGANLVGPVANHARFSDAFVLSDNSVIVAYTRTSGASVPTTIVKRYSSAGATLNTYDSWQFVSGNYRVNRLCSDVNAANFWIWFKRDAEAGLGGKAVFWQIRVSDGAVLKNFGTFEFIRGEPSFSYNAWKTAFPTLDIPIYGNSPSCPFWVNNQEIVAPNVGVGSPIGGKLYQLVKGKTNDIGTSIPDPMFKTGLVGS